MSDISTHSSLFFQQEEFQSSYVGHPCADARTASSGLAWPPALAEEALRVWRAGLQKPGPVRRAPGCSVSLICHASVVSDFEWMQAQQKQITVCKDMPGLELVSLMRAHDRRCVFRLW